MSEHESERLVRYPIIREDGLHPIGSDDLDTWAGRTVGYAKDVVEVELVITHSDGSKTEYSKAVDGSTGMQRTPAG